MKEKFSKYLKKIKINEKTINYVLIFVLGFLVGIAVKTEAKKRITIGYGDYLVQGMKSDLDLSTPAPSAPADNSAGSQAAPDQIQNSPDQQPTNNSVPGADNSNAPAVQQ